MDQNLLDVLGRLFEGVYVVDNERKVIFWNHGSEMITGFSKEEVLGKHCYDNILRHVSEDGVELCFGGCPLHHTILTGDHLEAKVYLHHKSGHRVPVSVKSIPLLDDDNNIKGAIEIFTDERFRKDAYLENRALKEQLSMDVLTKVPNRRFLDFYLDNMKKESDEFGSGFGVLFFDIDDFKHVNDTYGHNIGDEILKLIARTLKANVRTDDVIGRWGGEEFIGVIKVESNEQLMMISEKLRILVQHSTHTLEDDTKIRVTISIGGSLYKQGEPIKEVIERADTYMYHSKKNGKNQSTIK